MVTTNTTFSGYFIVFGTLIFENMENGYNSDLRSEAKNRESLSEFYNSELVLERGLFTLQTSWHLKGL